MKAKGKAAKFARVRHALEGLRDVASGAVVARAVLRFSKYIRGRITGELERHIDTGLARRSAAVVPTLKRINIRLQGYYRYIPWSWRKGVPGSVLSRGKKIVDEELQRATGGGAK